MRRPPLAVVEQAPSPLGLKRWEGPVGRLPADSRGVIPGGRDGRRREGTSGRGPPPYPQSSRQMVSMLGNARAPSPARGSGSICAMLGLQLRLQRSPSARKTCH